MIWWYLIVFIVTLVLSVALSPKPQGPQSAAIDDFKFPTAEEGRAIPVVFGTVDITGPNVLWYGDLSSSKIKKSSLFGSTTVGYKYYMGFHLGLCHGEADAVTNVTWGEKQAWAGNITTNGSGTINQTELFGGEKREGGVSGSFDINFGGDAQGPNAYLVSKLGAVPAYRGVVSFIWKTGTQSGPPGPFGGLTSVKSGYIGTTSYVKALAVRVRRILKGWHGDVWYSAKAVIDSQHMNPAHIMYQAMTDTEWGMGIPTANIDDAVFKAAADTFYDEGMGLSMIWNQTSTLEDFLQIILNHCAASLVLRNDTGQYQLIPIRGDYELDDLEEYTPSDIVSMDDFQRQGWGETTNEVTLIYTDPETGKDAGITQQDLGNIASQGSRIATKVELRGIRDNVLARTVLSRELASRSTPVAKGKFTINTRAWNVPFGRVFKLTWPQRQADNMACRVTGISRGTLKDNTIVIDWVEDIFALGLAGYLSDITNLPDADPLDPPPVSDGGESNGATVISSTQTAPPLHPADGDAYVVPNDATDVWAGHGGQVAIWNEDEQRYDFIDVPPGTIIFDQSTNGYVTVIGGSVGQPPLGDVDLDAEDIGYDDTNTALGADNVQEAIEALISASDNGAITVRAFANGLFRAQTANLELYDSPDGENYTARNTLGQTSLSQLVFSTSLNRYLALRNNEIGVTTSTSLYGAWTWTPVPGGPWLGLRVYSNGKHVAWSETSVVISTNGTTWASPGASSSYGSAVVADDPSMWLRMGDDGTYTQDSGPNAYTARFTPGVGELGTGLNVNQPGLVGEGKSVSCIGLTYVEPVTSGGGVVNIFEGTQDFTVEMWFRKYQAVPASIAHVLFSINRLLLVGTVPVLRLELNAARTTLTLVTRSLTMDFSSWTEDRSVVTPTLGTDIFDGVPHHIVISRGASGRLRIYLDGELQVEEASGTVSDFGSGVSLRAAGTIFGNTFNKNSPYFQSYVDEFATYDEELGDDRILEHWQLGSDGIQTDFAVQEIYWDEPNVQYLVFGQVPDEVSPGTFQYRPRVYTSPDLIEFTLLSVLGQTPVTDNWPIQQVASRIARDQIPEDVKFYLKRPDEHPASSGSASVSAYFGFQFRNPEVSPDKDLYIGDQGNIAARRMPAGKISFDEYLGDGTAVTDAGGTIRNAFKLGGILYTVCSPTGTKAGLRRWDLSVVPLNSADTHNYLTANPSTVYSTIQDAHYDYENDRFWLHASTNAPAHYLIELDVDDLTIIGTPLELVPIAVGFRDIGAVNGFYYSISDVIIKVDVSDATYELLDPGFNLGVGFRAGIAHGSYAYVVKNDGTPTFKDRLRRFSLVDGVEDTDFAQFVDLNYLNSFRRVEENPDWIVLNRNIAIDLTDEDNPVVYKDSVIAVMMRNLNSGGNTSKMAYSNDGGATWNYPSVSFPAGSPNYGADSIIYDGEKFLATGRGWSGVATDAITSWTFSGGDSGLPETSRFVPYHNNAGRIVVAVRGDFGIRGSLFSDDGLHWFEGPEIKAVASEIQYDNDTSGMTATDVQAALDELDGRLDALGNPDAEDVSFDPTGTSYSATDVQAALEEIDDDRGAVNGIATLDGSGKVPTSQLPATVLGAVEYKGTWNANTNSPDLGASSPEKGDYYVVATAGATSLGGVTDWKLGDWAIYNGTAWEKVDNSSPVVSVNGEVGVVTLNADDIPYNDTNDPAIGDTVQDAIDSLAGREAGGTYLQPVANGDPDDPDYIFYEGDGVFVEAELIT